MKDDSLSEWEEGGTAALTEGVGYRDPDQCQPSAERRQGDDLTAVACELPWEAGLTGDGR
jgi:hypothetical protein